MEFKKLTKEDKEHIINMYESSRPRLEIQEELANKFGVKQRAIRKWAEIMGIGTLKKTITINSSKVMIYDIETSGVDARVWWTGKQYINNNQLQGEPKIISIAYKWIGEDKVHTLTWDKNHCDKKMLKAFIKEYNKADMVVGQNNNRFDNRWVNARAFKFGIDINVHVKSFDIMKETKRLFRLPSYSMAYISQFLDVTLKQSHEGLIMWLKIEKGTKEEQKEYLQKMVDYNIGDIVSTEEIFLKIRKYTNHTMHFGVLQGEPKYTCPHCGQSELTLFKSTTTQAGTIQRIMKCKLDGVQFKINNKSYMDYLNRKNLI